MNKICVLLSTYNGEKYLEEQLESVVNQEGVEVEILVRDDGSTDDTCAILERWQTCGKLKWYKDRNLGFALSFIDLIVQAPECDYYAFCDQDDIWHSDKLKRASDTLDKIENPVKLYCSNVNYYKDGEVYGAIHQKVPYYDKYTCLIRNIAPGCSMVFSRTLKELIVSAPPKKIIAHDFWIFQLAVLMGTAVYDLEPSMLYRQHENNQIGQKGSICEKTKRRVKSLSSSKSRHEREEQAKELIRCHFDDIADDTTRSIILNIAEYRTSFRHKMNILFNGRYKMDTIKNTCYLKARILFNIL